MKLRIKDLRKDRGWTGDTLAGKVGITKGYVSEIETGKKTPGAATLIRLAEAFDIKVGELFEGDPAQQAEAELLTHLDVLRELNEVDRLAIFRSAQGLLAALQQSSDKR